MNDGPKILKVPTIRRLPAYLRILRDMEQEGIEFVSTTTIGEMLTLDAITVRKDLSITNVMGRPKIGYQVKELIVAIEIFLGWHNNSDAFLVGAGHLGQALMGYQGFAQYGLRIIAGFDINPKIVGSKIAGTTIFPLKELPYLIKRLRVEMLILCVPAEMAQEVADTAIEFGIKGIWNFTPQKLIVPDHIVVQREDMASGLAVLSAKLANQEKIQIEKNCHKEDQENQDD